MTKRTALVILGAAVWEDGPSPTLVRRTRHGAALFHKGLAEVVIPCGGLGKHPPSEADAMLTDLIADGIPRSVIHCEDQSTSTYENLRNAQAILQDLRINHIIIVTDRYHGPRALLVATCLGLTARYDAPGAYQAPLRLRLRRLVHEAAAILAYAICLPYWRWRDR